MDQQIRRLIPDYRRIYYDILKRDFPHKMEKCRPILEKEKLSVLDILELNERVFGLADSETERFNQSHRNYDKQTIVDILNYQKNQHLSNTQLASHFKLSRNTVARWKKLFLCDGNT